LLTLAKYSCNLLLYTVFSSPELKAQVSYSDRLLSICPSVCL
jgi:hypothetical protein